jgi:hypothetical protein
MTFKRSLIWIVAAGLVFLITGCGKKREAGDDDEDDKPAATAKAATAPSIPSAPSVVSSHPVVYRFDTDAAGKSPAHFSFARTGRGAEGTWVIQEDPTAPSKPNVLAQISTDKTDYRFPLAIADDGNYQDVAVSVKFKAVAGEVDEAGGIVFRYQDPNNYYIVRANALEDNYRLYHVVAGHRVQFAGSNFKVTPNEWHTLHVIARGDQFQCFYDGQLKLSASDKTFAGPGKVGLWTKADSVIHFDDLEISAP